MKREVVGSMSEWSGVLKDAFRQTDDGSLTLEHWKAFTDHKNPFGGEERKKTIIRPPSIDFSLWLSKWEKFYMDAFDRMYDFSRLGIPMADEIFAWPICMVPDISAEDWLTGGKNPQPPWKFTDKKLDDILDISFGRDGWEHPYIVRAKANEEADKGMEGISANKIVEMELNVLALKERLALGRFLFWDRKLILDRRTWTLCSGSRYRGGDVPGVDFCGGKVRVRWDDPDVAHPRLRARQAVS